MRVACLVGLVAALGVGCSGDTRRTPSDGAPPTDGTVSDGSADGTVDTGPAPMECTSNAECDDSVDCTIDSCGVGGVCRHLVEASLCSGDERCDPIRGCTTADCATDEECDDGVFCNGTERCIVGSGCFMDMAADCDDGNMCTVDTCDSDLNGCSYALADGCDAGLPPPTDSGPPPVTFDPTMHYDGSFVVAPSPSLDCSSASYAFSSIRFSTSGTELRVQADWMTLTQSPTPTGPDFDVRTTNPGCADYRLQGSFSDSNTLTGSWTAVMISGSACSSFCGNQTNMIFGSRGT